MASQRGKGLLSAATWPKGWLFWVRATVLKGRELKLEQAERADSSRRRLVVSRTGEGLTKSSGIAMLFGLVPISSGVTKLDTLSSSHHTM